MAKKQAKASHKKGGAQVKKESSEETKQSAPISTSKRCKKEKEYIISSNEE